MKERLPPLQALYYFYVAAETGSFKLAAGQLFVSAAAVSQQIRQLEDWFKCDLFVRQHRQVQLTNEGKLLYQSVSKGFSEIKNGVRLLTQDPDPGRLSISTIPSFAQHWLVPRLQLFRQQHPDMLLLVEPVSQLASFEDSSLDICIRYGKGNYDNLDSILLMDEVLYPVCHPLYQQQHQIHDIDDLYRADLIEDMWPDMNWALWLETVGANHASAARPTLKYNGALYVLEGALSVQGVGLAKHSMAYRLIQEGKLVRIGQKSTRSRYSYYLCGPESYMKREKIVLFHRWLSEQIEHFRKQYPHQTEVVSL
ncbi:Glycine cleavage system transcriptional activator [Vibrio aerogenes CECT 7868]|uniref:Glycine cleavage system transcriptional activator n=1 Tax=Vibrio aerogenes CECT 7868 TaxID=1216006 RepID=A0A1M5WM46_9VIBR|nr:LysR substrate-binding domain-containing protein [Vibrio aerogenes]SHH88621.1 Glycine cleavage system transcriptional activator [Vibrio aerogenes CECT 7868]